jgi:hypothetical protein
VAAVLPLLLYANAPAISIPVFLFAPSNTSLLLPVVACIVGLQPLAMVLRYADPVQLPRDYHHVHCHLPLALAGYNKE